MVPVPGLVALLFVMQVAVAPPPDVVRGELCLRRDSVSREQCQPTTGYRFEVPPAAGERAFVWWKQDGSVMAAGSLRAGDDTLDLSDSSWRPIQLRLDSDAEAWPVPVTLAIRYGDDRDRVYDVTVAPRRVAPLRQIILLDKNAQLTATALHHSAVTRTIAARQRDLGTILLRLAPAITGTIIADGAPVLGASIKAGDAATETDALGRFRLELPAAWPEAIRITAPAFAPRLVLLPRLQREFDAGTITLVRGGAIRAQVSGVDVKTADLLLASGDRFLTVKSAAPADGVLELAPVEPGSYVLLLKGERELQRFASEVSVENGITTEVTLPLKTRKLRINVAADDRPVASELQIMRPSGDWNATLRTSDTGTVTAEAWQEGEFHVFVGRDGRDSIMTNEAIDPAPDEVVWDIDLPSKRVAGRVIAEGGQPLPGVKVSLESFDGEGASHRSVTTGADGTFEFVAVAAGEQTLTGILSGYVKSTSSFALGQDDKERLVTLELARAFARAVQIVDTAGRPLPKAVLVDEAGGMQRVADDNGSATIELKKGERRTFYVLPPQGSFTTVSITAPEAADSTPLRVVVPPGPAQLRVVAQTRKNAPVPGVFFAIRHNGKMLPLTVQFAMLDRHGVPVQTGPDGNALIPALPLGVYELWPYSSRRELPRIFDGLVEPAARIVLNQGPNVVTFTFEDPRS